jgi:alkanesulfonate monooxygenase SsuD/methylene tetrahydromethanopterin reductase-like flavin-dependent oxidoreductase (luciferase family)
MASSPAVYLSAVAQRSKRLRFGPMVFCLPLYHPLRIAEEICMLDQMSGGRFDLGVGRGISPLESRSYGESPEKEVTQEVYVESLAILKKAMEGGKFSHAGKHRSVEDVEMTIGPAQKPHPPLWMGVQTVANAEFAARNGMSMLSLLSAPQLRDKVERHREVWRATHGASTAPGKQGVGLFIVVAETEGKAKEIANRAYRKWHESFHYLYHLHGRKPMWGDRPPEFSIVEDEVRGVAGTPDTVLTFVKQRVAECGANYVTGQFAFGDMTRAEALRSVELFGRDVLPALKAM